MADNSISGRSCGSRDFDDGQPHNPGVPVDVSRLLFSLAPLSLFPCSRDDARIHRTGMRLSTVTRRSPDFTSDVIPYRVTVRGRTMWAGNGEYSRPDTSLSAGMLDRSCREHTRSWWVRVRARVRGRCKVESADGRSNKRRLIDRRSEMRVNLPTSTRSFDKPLYSLEAINES